MKRLLAIAVVAAVLIAAVAAVSAAEQRVTDKTGSFSLAVPAGWTLQPADEENNIAANRVVNGVIRSNFNVGEEEVGQKSLDDYEKAARVQMPKEIKGARIVSRSKTKLGGIAAYQWIYVAKLEGKPFKFKTVLAANNGTVHIFTYTSLDKTFTKDIAGFDAAMKSVKWN